MLQDYINPQEEAPKEEQPEEVTVQNKEAEEEETPPFNEPYVTATTTAPSKPSSVASKFDDLFGEEN
jgi:hypothetical protein